VSASGVNASETIRASASDRESNVGVSESERRRCERQRAAPSARSAGASERTNLVRIRRCEREEKYSKSNTQHDPSVYERDSAYPQVRAKQCVRTHKCERDSAFRVGKKRANQPRIPSVVRLPSNSQDRRHATSRCDVTSSHTHAPVGTGAGQENCER